MVSCAPPKSPIAHGRLDILTLRFLHHQKRTSPDNTMKSYFLLLQAVLAQAAIRFGCSSVSIQRLDPLVEPGRVPSSHVSIIITTYVSISLQTCEGTPDRW